MTFKHKLSRRLALLFSASAAVAFAMNACELPRTVSTTISVTQVIVTPPAATTLVGQTVQLSATPEDASGNPLSGRAVLWATSQTNVATVDGNGLVSALAAGTATITATSEGRSGTAALTVTVAPPVPVATVSVSPPA